MIVRNKEEAIKKKKAREPGVQVESEIHKKQKSKPSENLKKRNSEALEEEEETSPSKKQKNKWTETKHPGSRGFGTRELK